MAIEGYVMLPSGFWSRYNIEQLGRTSLAKEKVQIQKKF